MLKKMILAALFALLALPGVASAAAPPLPVVASFTILADMVKTIGGDAVTVTTLVGADGDVHTYQPTPDAARAIAAARLVFVNGLGLEGWVDRLIQAANPKVAVVVASRGVQPRTLVADDGKKGQDPHAWQNLANGLIYATNIAAALEQALPEQASRIAARAEAYKAAIRQLDGEVRQHIAAIPPARRVVITSHDAFGYFAAAYGVRFLAPLGISTEADASANDVAKLIQQMQQQQVDTVFLENMTNSKLIAQIAKDSHATIGGTLYADSLSAPTGPAPTYLAMFHNNLPKLVAAMQRR